MPKSANFYLSCSSSTWLCIVAASALTMSGATTALAKGEPYSVVYTFTGGADGGVPSGNLITDGQGNFYGTTTQGGNSIGSGYGTVFKITPDGTETVLYSFQGGSDGALPLYGSLIKDKEGNLYGTTSSGGANGHGVVFKLAPDGTETPLYAFAGGQDGDTPQAGLARDGRGNLYGTTVSGGANNAGTVFRVAPDGTETVLHSFTGGADGGAPDADLTKVGVNLFGVASTGGGGGGTIFELVKGRKGTFTFQVVHAFTGGTDGGSPGAKLTADSAGNLYGTASTGGAYGFGNIFKLAPDGTETVLYSFTGGADGANPYSGVRMSLDGGFYGVTSTGGATRGGTVFEVAPDGTETTLHTFTGDVNDGANPYFSGPLAAKGQYLYGATNNGGAHGTGVVFKVKK